MRSTKKSCNNCKEKSCMKIGGNKKNCNKIGGAGKIPTREIVQGAKALGEISTAVAPLIKSFTGMFSSNPPQQPPQGGNYKGNDENDYDPLILVSGAQSFSGGKKSQKSVKRKKSKKSVNRKKSKKSVRRKKSKRSVNRKKSKKSVRRKKSVNRKKSKKSIKRKKSVNRKKSKKSVKKKSL